MLSKARNLSGMVIKKWFVACMMLIAVVILGAEMKESLAESIKIGEIKEGQGLQELAIPEGYDGRMEVYEDRVVIYK